MHTRTSFPLHPISGVPPTAIPSDQPRRAAGWRPRRALILALAVGAVAACGEPDDPASPASSPGAHPRPLVAPAECGRMIPGEGLQPDVSVRSCNGEAMLVLQTDGNLVLYDRVGAVWSAPNTLGRGTTLFQMQHDGNAVAYNSALQPPQALWATNTANPVDSVKAWFAIQNDCNLVVYRGPFPQAGGVLWASNTVCRAASVAPVAGPFRVTKTENPDCYNVALPTWTFCQHRTGLHRPGGGVAGADDTYAWDVNLTNSADTGKPVYASAPGWVVKYGGSVLPGGGSGAVLIEHNANGRTWWSGYLHMTGIQVTVGQAVTAGSLIGYVGSVGAPTPHLHYVMYTGTNTSGGLRSYDGQFAAR